MKLVVQVPCFNEEKTLGVVLSQIPKKIPGVDKIEIQIIDDGSTDETIKVAKEFGVTRIIVHKTNKGLGVTFSDGLNSALVNGADILVNTDGDNQYPGKYISDLVAPIIRGEADMVIADRQTDNVEHFSKVKKLLQRVGSKSVRYLSETNVPDAVSGFRAYSREAMLEINPITKFSYCIDTIIQAGKKGLKIVSIPIKINPPTRKSRLFSNTLQHVFKSSKNLLKMFIVYEPFKTFLLISIVLATPSVFFIVRWLYFYIFVPSEAGGHLQSLILGSALLMVSIQILALGILADLVNVNRSLIEKTLKYYKKNDK